MKETSVSARAAFAQSSHKALAKLAVACFLSVAPLQSQSSQLAAHGDLYKHLDFGVPYDKRTRDNTGTVDLSAGMIYDYVATQTPPTPREELTGLAKLFPLIVMGEAISAQSALTPRRSFIHSYWSIRINAVIKDSLKLRPQIGSSITVSRSGGDLWIDGIHLIARDENSPALVVGDTYILFLKDLKDGSCQSLDDGTFHLAGLKVEYLVDPRNNVTTLRQYCNGTNREAFLGLLQEVVQAR